MTTPEIVQVPFHGDTILTRVRELVDYVAARRMVKHRPLELYVITFGDKVKVGVTDDYQRRMAEHAHAADAAGVDWHPHFRRQRHLEARANERALIRRFNPVGRRSEYLTADLGEVLRFARALPVTLITSELYNSIQKVAGLYGAVNQWPEWVWDQAVERRRGQA